jgi:hypothetical protein
MIAAQTWSLMRPYGFSGNSAVHFQRHHLIPVNVIGRRAFAKLFAVAGRVGFDARNFLSNGVLLPATEKMAEATGLPLHRGPHKYYDQIVAECLSTVANKQHICAISACRDISELQGSLRRALHHGSAMMLNRNDPRGVASPLLKLDHDILQIGAAALLA